MNLRTERACSLSSTHKIVFFGLIVSWIHLSDARAHSQASGLARLMGCSKPLRWLRWWLWQRVTARARKKKNKSQRDSLSHGRTLTQHVYRLYFAFSCD